MKQKNAASNIPASPEYFRMYFSLLSNWLAMATFKFFFELCPERCVTTASGKYVIVAPDCKALLLKSASSIQKRAGSSPPVFSNNARGKNKAAPESISGEKVVSNFSPDMLS